jgi:hypothetical protein
MNSSNKKLKKYAEALNDAAPKGEFLAFINPQESELLRRNGALGLLTDFGIPSYRNAYGGGGQYGGGGGNTGGGGGGEGNRMSYATGGQYGGGKSTEGEGNGAGQRAKELEAARVREQARIQSQLDAQKRAQEKKAANERAAKAREQARIQSQLDAQKKAAQKKAAQEKKAADERAARLREEAAVKASRDKAAKEREIKGRDPSKQYETPTDLTIEQKETLEEQRQQAQYAISPSTDPKNQTIKTLLNLGIFPGVGNLYSAYLDATALGYPLSASFPDLSNIFGGGDISQQMENIQSIQGGNGDDGGGGGMGQVSTPVAPVAPSNNLPPSMVNQYFANLNLGQALSSDLQTNYNNAKNTMNNLLGINPTSQQFGYSADPYGGLMASNLTTNPYNIDYLRRLGLI